MLPISQLVVISSALASLVRAHTILTYPGWRGDNLLSSGVVGVDDDTTGNFPYGRQWMYPCGGMPITTNRTKWPTTGGAVAFQPGWFSGHKTALIYINIGLGSIPPNYSHIMQPVFQIVLPTNDPYIGASVCLPQVGLPANLSIKAGDNATIQLVEAAQHGAALYNCADITFTDDMNEVAEVNATNCFNSTYMKFASVFSTRSLKAASAATGRTIPLLTTWLGAAALSVCVLAVWVI